MTFKIDGREYKSYELSNEQLLRLYKDETLSPEEKEEVTRTLVNNFEYHLCPNAGENNDDVFVRFFSNFVNGVIRHCRISHVTSTWKLRGYCMISHVISA